VGDRTKKSFWHDLWCGNYLLKESFLELFSIVCYKGTWVADHLQFSNGNIQWKTLWLRFTVLYTFSLRQGGRDSFWWMPSKW
jgi:hypothetical protein